MFYIHFHYFHFHFSILFTIVLRYQVNPLHSLLLIIPEIAWGYTPTGILSFTHGMKLVPIGRRRRLGERGAGGGGVLT